VNKLLMMDRGTVRNI